jgi:hypothetical protein
LILLFFEKPGAAAIKSGPYESKQTTAGPKQVQKAYLAGKKGCPSRGKRHEYWSKAPVLMVQFS